jgi:hypothetical protein
MTAHSTALVWDWPVRLASSLTRAMSALVLDVQAQFLLSCGEIYPPAAAQPQQR